MDKPSDKLIIEKSIKLILSSMIYSDEGLPCKAESKLAWAVVLLNQITELESFDNIEIQEQFDYCREITLGLCSRR
jgi:hypothetical protein